MGTPLNDSPEVIAKFIPQTPPKLSMRSVMVGDLRVTFTGHGVLLSTANPELLDELLHAARAVGNHTARINPLN